VILRINESIWKEIVPLAPEFMESFLSVCLISISRPSEEKESPLGDMEPLH
jgi:hypothetical protein